MRAAGTERTASPLPFRRMALDSAAAGSCGNDRRAHDRRLPRMRGRPPADRRRAWGPSSGRCPRANTAGHHSQEVGGAWPDCARFRRRRARARRWGRWRSDAHILRAAPSADAAAGFVEAPVEDGGHRLDRAVPPATGVGKRCGEAPRRRASDPADAPQRHLPDLTPAVPRGARLETRPIPGKPRKSLRPAETRTERRPRPGRRGRGGVRKEHPDSMPSHCKK